MTRLDYSKLPEPDPGKVIEVRESGLWSGNDAHPFETEGQRRERRAKERAATAERSEIIRYKAIIKKFGLERAVESGVPREFVAAALRAKARARRKQELRAAKQRSEAES